MIYNRILTIAGSDSGGGAGVQADIKTISALGGFATSAVTAITAQNTLGVMAVHPIPIDIIRAQIDAVLSDIGTNAVKVGMLHSAEVVATVVEAIDRYRITNLVVDPVMVSTSGHRLIEEAAVEMLKEELLPRARVITPNIPEAEVLLGVKITSQEQLMELSQELSCGCSVLLKAGHMAGDMLTDILYDAEQDNIIKLASPRIVTPNTHGTGCTLSAALATLLGQGLELNEAAREAKDYISGAIASGAQYTIGGGHGAVNHFFNTNKLLNKNV